MFRLVIIAISVSLAYGASLDAIIGDDYIRVIGGEEIDILESPWQVAIQREYSHEGDFYLVCSGSIIGLNYILTTGSCVHGVPIGALRARAGSNSHKEGGSVYLLSEMIIHPSFSIQTYDYDVAVLTTRLAISTSALVSSATLPTPGIEIPTGSFGSSTGWGSYEPSNPSLSDNLRQIEVPILEQAACGSVFSEERMTPRMVCAGGETGHGACRGDSGNPLVISRVLVGVLSRTGLCGVAGQPGVYTNIPVVVEWVNSQMRRR